MLQSRILSKQEDLSKLSEPWAVGRQDSIAYVTNDARYANPVIYNI